MTTPLSAPGRAAAEPTTAAAPQPAPEPASASAAAPGPASGAGPATASRPRIQDILGLSPLQQGLLFHAELDDSGHDVYTVQLKLRLEGPLDKDALWRAAGALLRRHPHLGAAFRHRKTGEPVQILTDRTRIPRTEEDLSGLDGTARATELDRLEEEQRTERFDLSRPPAFRFMLVKLAAQEHRLLLTCHHILVDGWSLPLLVDELTALYRTAAAGGEVPEQAGLPPAVPYRDHLRWLAGRDEAESRAEWRRALDGLDEPTYLVPGGRASGSPVKLQRALSPEATDGLTALARREGLTLNTVVQGAWALLLGRLTRREDVVFGAVVSGRPSDLPGSERMIGLFINTVPVRVRLRQDEPFAEALPRLQREQARLLEHQYLGLAETQRLAPGSHFDTLLVFQNYPAGPDEDAPGSGLRVTGVDAHDATHYPVSLMAVPGERLLLDLTFRDAADVPGGAARLLDRVAEVLEQAARRPGTAVGDFDILSEGERRALLGEWIGGGPRHAVPPRPAAPIGRPIPGDRAYVLGLHGDLLPPEVKGELYLAGAGLARGYINRPALTASSFVPDPYGEPGTRMYRTGDLARWRADGQLEYLGRADHQVKIRGYRVELTEIESALIAHSGLSGAAVLAREDTPGHRRLVAYVVARPGERPTDEDVRRHLGASLPDYMVPSTFVWLDAVPVTTHGKVDRDALPAPGASGAGGSGRRPVTGREKAVCAAVGEVLAVDDVTLDDNLFDLGCDSLTAGRLVGRVNAELGLGLTVRRLYESPTVSGILTGRDASVPGARGADAAGLDMLLPVRREGSRPPLFCFHPGSGLSWCYTGLTRHLGPDQPILGVQAAILTDPDSAPDSVEAMAGGYLALMRRVQPTGPYRLFGWSFGGVVAHAVACLLEREAGQTGEEATERVEFLALLDSFPQAATDEPGGAMTAADERRLFAEGLGLSPESLGDGELTPSRVLKAARDEENQLAGLDEHAVAALMKASAHHVQLMSTHTPGRYEGDVVAFDAGSGRPLPESSAVLWRPFVGGAIEQHVVDGVHEEMMSARALERIAPVIARGLGEGRQQR
ncbi:condensation domain-containing protein [Streptomyces winkii]|uniref:condensation domain-containing protein n=1 Tax=Streptomyces winkii TaxID=3051178 RepID=UPI0028D22B05|nr:condensation domain-containing protein [Streptomyces sp. DSM 40971]